MLQPQQETEEQAQTKVFDWAEWNTKKYEQLKLMYHPANEGKRTQAAGARLKRQGLKNGVSDICLPVRNGTYSNLYVELKVGKNKPTPDQIEFVEDINRFGGFGLIVYGSDNAIQVIETYIKNKTETLEIENNVFPANRAANREKNKFGFCGKECKNCNNTGCLGRVGKWKGKN